MGERINIKHMLKVSEQMIRKVKRFNKNYGAKKAIPSPYFWIPPGKYNETITLNELGVNLKGHENEV